MSRRALGWLGLHATVTIFALLALGATVSFVMKPAHLLHPLSLMLLLLWSWMLFSWRRVAGSLFNLYGLFLILAGLFNAGQAFLEVLWLNPEGFLRGRVTDDTSVATLMYVIFGLLLLHCGALIAVVHHRRLRPVRVGVNSDAQQEPMGQALRISGVFFLSISAYPLLDRMLSAAAVVSTGGYIALYQEATATGVGAAGNVLASFFLPGVLFLTAGVGRRRPQLIGTALVMGGYVLFQLLLGYRGWPVLALLGYAWVFSRTAYRIPNTVAVGTAAAFVFVISPIVFAIRNTPGHERISLRTIASVYADVANPAVATISEMGQSAVTIAHTIALVPESRDFDLGASYLLSMLAVVPNVAWDIHPAIARGLPSDWLTRTVEPVIWAQGGGLGYSVFAEAYLNFGWFGGVFLALLGFSLSLLSLWIDRQRSPPIIAACGVYMSFVLFVTRSDSIVLFRPLVWYAMAPLVVYWIVFGLLTRRVPPGTRPQSPWSPARSGGEVARVDGVSSPAQAGAPVGLAEEACRSTPGS